MKTNREIICTFQDKIRFSDIFYTKKLLLEGLIIILMITYIISSYFYIYIYCIVSPTALSKRHLMVFKAPFCAYCHIVMFTCTCFLAQISAVETKLNSAIVRVCIYWLYWGCFHCFLLLLSSPVICFIRTHWPFKSILNLKIITKIFTCTGYPGSSKVIVEQFTLN